MANSQKPIIFLAFANPKKDLDEDLEINLFQKLFNQETDFEHKFIFAADAKAIYEFFRNPQHRGRICIFHYSGHANKKYVLLNDKLTHGGALGSFLALQVGLQLVVLNACETQNLGTYISEKGIPSVIATSQPVKDQKAACFTENFYKNLLDGNTVEKSFENATSVIDSVSTSLALVRGLDTGREVLAGTEYISLYNQEYDKEWTLAKTLNDPYVGLPKLPSTAYDNLPETPFIGLRHYGKSCESDGKIIDTSPLFFGRSASIRELFVSIKSPERKLILLYGKSGVGKSSLLAAGMQGRLQQDSYAVKYLRRRSEGLIATLADTLQCTDGDYQSAWIHIEKTRDRPLIVILDQVEEAITNHSPEEIECLAETVIPIFNLGKQDEYTGETLPSPIRGKLILGYREEFHGQIEHIFRQQGIANEKVLIEALTPDSIREVVEGIPNDPELFKKYKLTVPSSVTERIQAKLSEDSSDAISPVLQLLLTNMWEKTEPNNKGEKEFSIELLEELLKGGIWIKNFVQQQLDKLKESFSIQVKSGLVLDVLHYLTTDLGSARTISTSAILLRYDTDSATLTELLKKLDDLYLVVKTKVEGEEGYRLSHDTLAPVVREMYAKSILPGQLASRLLAGKDISGRNPFGESDLKILTAGKEGMKKWSNEPRKAYEESQRHLVASRRSTRFLRIGIAVSILIAFGILGFSYWSSQINLLVGQLIYLSEQSEDKTLAVQAAYKAWKLDSKDISAARLLDTNLDKAYYRRELVTGGYSLNYLCISHDGKYLAIATDTVISVYDVQTLALLQTLSGDEEAIKSVAFSPDGRTLASGEGDRIVNLSNWEGGEGTMKLWDWKSGKLLQTFHSHDRVVYSVAFSPDGTTLASGGGNGMVELWDCMNGKHLQTLSGHNDDVLSVAFSPDGNTLVSGGEDGTVKLWGWREGKPLQTLVGDEDAVICVAFSPDGDTLASGGSDGMVKLWDRKNGKLLQTLVGHQEAIISVAFSPNGTTLASGGWDKNVKIWDCKSGKLLQTLAGHDRDVSSVAFSPDGTSLISGGWDGTVKFWDWKGRRFQQTLPGDKNEVICIAFSPKGNTLASGLKEGTVKLWDWRSGRSLRTFFRQNGNVSSLDFSSDGTVLASGGGSGMVELWDCKDGKSLQTLSRHKEDVLSVIFSPDGKTLASGGEEGMVNLWDWKEGKLLQTLSGHDGAVSSVAFSPDGRTLASGGMNGGLWDWEDERLLQTLSVNEDAVICVAFSPNGHILASGGSEGMVKLWDCKNGKLLQTLAGHDRDVSSVAFSPDGNILASGGWDGTVKLWGSNNGKLLQTLSGHRLSVSSIAFSPDGTILASGGEDGTVMLWEMFDIYLNNPHKVAAISRAKYYINGIRATSLQEVLVASRDDSNDLMRLTAYFNKAEIKNLGYNLYHLKWCYEQLINLTKSESERKCLTKEKNKIEAELKEYPVPFYLKLWWAIQRVWYSMVLFFESLV